MELAYERCPDHPVGNGKMEGKVRVADYRTGTRNSRTDSIMQIEEKSTLTQSAE